MYRNGHISNQNKKGAGSEDEQVTPSGEIAEGEASDGIDRRGFLKCMAWTGAGLVWTVTAGGLISSRPLASIAATRKPGGFSFVQLSDSHIGFNKEGVNTDVTGTLQQVITRINSLPEQPALVLHTGDLTHSSTPEQFDTVHQVMGTLKTSGIFYVPGEHDVIGDNGAEYRKKFSPRSGGRLYYSMDYGGAHFIALSNIGGEDVFGVLGAAQLEWLKKDLSVVRHDTPIVVFAHVPLYAVYPAWGWYTKDSAQALAMLQPFSSVTVLNGHIHQVMSHVEGQIHFHIANSTAFPQHHPGDGKAGPYPLASGDLLRSLGYTTTMIHPGRHSLSIIDTELA